MLTPDIEEKLACKLSSLCKISVKSMDKKILAGIAAQEVEEFTALDVMKMFFLNRNSYRRPSLFMALNKLWTQLDFHEWIEITRELDACIDCLVPWVFNLGKYMGVDGMKAALDSPYLSPETKVALQQRLQKGTPQPLRSHVEELGVWGIDFDHIHESMIRSGAPPIPEGHDYYGYGENFLEG